MNINCKIALITGGASGIGKLHAEYLAKQGAKVAILDINEEELQKTAMSSPNIYSYKCDVTNLNEVKETVAKIETLHGPIDRLISCAAIMPGGKLLDRKAEEINRIMTINYCGMVNICQTIIPGMLKRNVGDVIIYGSTAGIVRLSKFGGYGASKAANNFYAKVLMKENRKSNLRFQLVCPAAVDTPLINQAKDTGPGSLKNIQKTKRNLTTPEQVVRSVEKCLKKGKQINYPGSAIWVKLLYPLFPRFIEWITEKE